MDDAAWTKHIIEREELKAEVARLRAEVDRLKAERHTTKRMLEDILEKHGQPRTGDHGTED